MTSFNATSDDSSTVCPRQFVIPADASLRVCRIDQLMKVSYSVADQVFTNCFAKVSWYHEHPSRYLLGKSVQVWSRDWFESDSFLPLNHTYIHQCVHTQYILSDTEENVLVVIPCTS